MSHTFLIYALHSFVGATIAKIVYMIMPPTQSGLVLTAVITFPTTIIIICVIGWLLNNHFPLLKQVLTGR